METKLQLNIRTLQLLVKGAHFCQWMIYFPQNWNIFNKIRSNNQYWEKSPQFKWIVIGVISWLHYFCFTPTICVGCRICAPVYYTLFCFQCVSAVTIPACPIEIELAVSVSLPEIYIHLWGRQMNCVNTF